MSTPMLTATIPTVNRATSSAAVFMGFDMREGAFDSSARASLKAFSSPGARLDAIRDSSRPFLTPGA
jgi:hypothetical protein